ncbi:MAG: glycosyltransferase [Desulfobacterales bacterium]
MSVAPPAIGTPGKMLWFAFGLLACIAALGSGIHLSFDNQILMSTTVIAALYLSGWAKRFNPDISRIMVILLGAFLSWRYWVFRTTETLSYPGAWDLTFMTLLYLAETYGILIHSMGMIVNVSPLTRRVPPLPADHRRLPTVDVFIPTYNEPVEVVRVTLSACTQLDYPRNKLAIYLLDDGGTIQKLNDPDPVQAAAARRRAQTLRAMAERMGVRYLAREANTRAKAGNINDGLLNCACEEIVDISGKAGCVNHGFHRSSGELVLILDCDHVPTRDFLQSTVGFFLEDSRLFLVQTPHFFINPTPVEKNLDTRRRSPTENEMFYGAIHLGLDFWNASFFCGSAALLRRRCLEEIGGVAGETITEDAETALELHARGYRSVYLNKPMVMGLSPESFDHFIIQRSRWAQGMMQMFVLKNPLFKKGLSLGQRLCYFNSCFFWLFGLARIIFFISPLLFLFFGLRIYNASLTQVAIYAVPHLLASYYVTNYLFGRLRHPFFSELYETIQSIFLAPAVLSVFRHPRRPRFHVTPKTISTRKDALTPLSVPFYIMLLLSAAAYPVGISKLVSNPLLADTVFVCLAWNTFNLVLTLCCLGVVWERRQIRRAHRYETREPVALRVPGSEGATPATLIDLSTAGVRVVAEPKAEITGDRLILEARDGAGRPHALPLSVRRRVRQASGLILGCEFDQPDEQTYGRIIDFVYGDSGRWKYFHDAKLGRTVNSLKGFLIILGIGVRGSLRNLAGIGRLLAALVAGIGFNFANSIKWFGKRI